MAQARSSYFTRFEEFDHDETAALLKEFSRLAITQNWSPHSQRYRQEKDKCIAEEFHRHYGRDDNNLHRWQELCREVSLDPPSSINKCKKVVLTCFAHGDQTNELFQSLSKVAVNIVDLVDSRRSGAPVHIFKSVAQLKKYSIKSGKIFSRQKAKDDGYLKVLLRRLF